jgi:hypothetical protein
MQLTLSTAITLLTCAVGSVSATLSGRSALGSSDTSFEGLAARHEAGLPDPRVSKRNLGRRNFDPAVQTLANITAYDASSGATVGCLLIFGNMILNSTTQCSSFIYVTAAAANAESFDLEYPEQGGAWTLQLTAATKQAATVGLNSPNVSAEVKSDLYVGAYPLQTPVGATPTYDSNFNTWYETAVWTAAADGTLTCTWVNPDGAPVAMQPYLIAGSLHLSPNPPLLYVYGGPWYTMQTVTLKLTTVS